MINKLFSKIKNSLGTIFKSKSSESKEILESSKNVRIFDLNFKGEPDPGSGIKHEITQHHGLRLLFDSRKKINKLIHPIDENSIIMLDHSSIPEKTHFTHSGLIQYIYIAWARELGVVLSPDMLFFTIISEIRSDIIGNPKIYRELFTYESEKKDIVLTSLTIESLMEVLSKIVPSRTLFDLATKTSFSTSPPFFDKVMGIIFADMASPYYNYLDTMCGIPKISIEGTLDDWNKLLICVKELRKIFKEIMRLDSYLNNILERIKWIIDATFFKKKGDDTMNKKYFREIFNYRKNPMCGSGHWPIITEGWIREFYITNYNEIDDYPSHLNCLAYSNRDDPDDVKYYYYSSGLTSSRIDGEFLRPEYTIWHCKIVHPEAKTIFNVIASNTIK